MAHLQDSFGRIKRDLRISVTDKCNLRCTYCMPAEGLPWLPGPELLTVEEILTVAEVCVSHGVEKIRLTGGEPLLRRELLEIISGLAKLSPRPEISLTSNGLGLEKMAGPLRDAGLNRINISLDTLDRDRFLKRLDRAVEIVICSASDSSPELELVITLEEFPP